MPAECWAWGLRRAAIAPVLPVGRLAAGHCMRCGYDLTGLPASAKTRGGVRCPECGDHPSAAAPRVG